MTEVAVNNWEEFEERVKGLHEGRSSRLESGGPKPSHFLFRGQENSSWNLSTTLERAGREGMWYRHYFELISRIHPEIQSCGFGRWSIRIPPDFDKSLSFQTINSGQTPNQEEYSYMVFLRHHGFPSPLLDWTRSEYVAAFFAFRKPNSDSVAIYVYQQTPEGFHASGSDRPFIKVLGHYVETIRQHFLQQCEHTICLNWTNQLHFARHEEVFAPPTTQACRPSLFQQDALWKFVLPAAERIKVLKRLEAHNLNGFSLFATAESLMDTLALRELLLRKQQ